MSEQFTRDSGERHEEVVVTREPGYEQRHEVVENVGLARRDALYRLTQVVWLVFGLFEALILLRVVLKLIAANPASPFASMVYSITDLFLWPFFGLTATPQAGGMVLEIPSLIAIIVYALIAWVIVRVIWLLAPAPPTRTTTIYERDDLP